MCCVHEVDITETREAKLCCEHHTAEQVHNLLGSFLFSFNQLNMNKSDENMTEIHYHRRGLARAVSELILDPVEHMSTPAEEDIHPHCNQLLLLIISSTCLTGFRKTLNELN